ncbi:hypothetical protein KN815_03585 [Streptomyces sp. 4503]|uniref:Transposase n=1 Tax=Streptomyces niphimycinicus TaxID=2842201 RepID=A0ABS6C8M6_9ACTN|nr:hypothetical protein [Streptomyces niphimycinicus]
MQGILHVLHREIVWQPLPLKLKFGSGQTCWRRLGRWQKVWVYERLRCILLAELNAAGELDWTRACVDDSHVRAKEGDSTTGPSPVDRRKTGSNYQCCRTLMLNSAAASRCLMSLACRAFTRNLERLGASGSSC